MVIKLNKANVMLYKIRQFVNERTLISIYHAICDSHLNYVSIVWRQTKSSINRIILIQKKAIRTIHFKSKFHHTSSLFSESDIIKLQLPEIFNWFVFSSDTHRYGTSCSEKGMLKVKSFTTKSHGKEAVIHSSINTWNSLKKQLNHFLWRNLSTFQLNFYLKYHYLRTYQH